MKTILYLSVLAMLLILTGCSDRKEKEKAKIEKKRENRIVYTQSIADIKKLFNDINYSLQSWDAGRREIPRLYLTDISSRWGDQSQRIPVKLKKAIFFQLAIPLILRSNELLIAQRKKLLFLAKKFNNLTKEELAWLRTLAKRYKLIKSEDEILDRAKVNELLSRLNIIPPSLALAQAAEESGWGTSRFAMLGNSLFGQWDFSGKGIPPAQQRKELGNYGLARFETPLHAVQSYMLNLNTHRAYRRLREKRAQMQASGKKIRGYELAETLDRYSERRYAYVESLHTMMNYNHLWAADDAYLWDKETIYLTPLPDPEPVVEKSAAAIAKRFKDISDRNQTAKTKANGSVAKKITVPVKNNKSTGVLPVPLTAEAPVVEKSTKSAVILSGVDAENNNSVQTHVSSSEVFKSILDVPEDNRSDRIRWEDN